MVFPFLTRIDLYFLIAAASGQIFNPIVELAMHKRKSTNDANIEIKTQTLTSLLIF